MSRDSSRKSTNERNRQILKTLLNDPANKYCADCKTAAHPRWTSWNLGVFVCIRCSGIHRGMGTHISRVRSVDLDSWSDEQVGNMVKWGNKRANLYWEHKLPEKYVPDDSKINNFIKTKYDLKRWVMSPEVPDPSTLVDVERSQNESTPLSQVKNRATNGSKVFRPVPANRQARSEATSTATSTATSSSHSLIPDLLGEGFEAPRASATTQVEGPSGTPSDIFPPPPVPKDTSINTSAAYSGASSSVMSPVDRSSAPTPPKADSLLGLDFSNVSRSSSPAASIVSSRPASSASRPDLKKSILALYASQRASQTPFNGVTSPQGAAVTGAQSNNTFEMFRPMTTPPLATSAVGSPNNLSLSGLSLSSAATPGPLHSDPFGSLSTHSNQSSTNVWATLASSNTPTDAKRTSVGNDEWASFTSAPPQQTTSFEDDIFSNVWK